MELLKVVFFVAIYGYAKFKNAVWRGVGSLIFWNIVTKNISSDLFKSLWRQNICTESTEIGGSGHENKNQAINWWWAWQLLLLKINPEIICCEKRRMKEYSAFIKTDVYQRSAADIVSLVARRSAMIHWHDVVCGVACRLACDLTCEAAHVSGGVGIILPKRPTFQGKFRFSQSQWSGDFWWINVWRKTDENLHYMQRAIVARKCADQLAQVRKQCGYKLQLRNIQQLDCGCDSWREVPARTAILEWERKAPKSGRRTCQFVG